MELFNLSTPNTCPCFFCFSPSAPPFSITIRPKSCIQRVRISKFRQATSLQLSSPIYVVKSFRVSAHFHQRTGRRNSLRRKLIDDQKVRRNPSSLIPSPDSQNLGPNFDRIDTFKDTTSGGRAEEGNLNASDHFAVEFGSDRKLSAESIGESVRLARLESWIDQYKKDAEFWGIGTGHIFMVLQDLEGNVKQVIVNEDEVLKRSKVYGLDFEDLTEANSKILHAKELAREMEQGENVIPSNSSVAKFAVANEGASFVTAIRGAVSSLKLIPKLTRIGSSLLCCVMVLLAVKKLLAFGNKEIELTQLEKEMIRGEIKSRKEKEVVKKSRVEVVQETVESPSIVFQKPMLDKQELMNNISREMAEKKKLVPSSSSTSENRRSINIVDKIEEIKSMAQEARDIESREQSVGSKNVEGKVLFDTNDQEVGKNKIKDPSAISHSLDSPQKDVDNKGTVVLAPSEIIDENNATRMDFEPSETVFRQTSITACVDMSRDCQNKVKELKEIEGTLPLMAEEDLYQTSDMPGSGSHISGESSSRRKPRVILSVQEAREYLSRKSGNIENKREPLVSVGESQVNSSLFIDTKESVITRQTLQGETEANKTFISSGASESTPAENDLQNVTPIGNVPTFLDDNGPVKCTYLDKSCQNFVPDNESVEKNTTGDKEYGSGVEERSTINHKNVGSGKEIGSMEKTDNWIRNNFHEVEPVLKKMEDGFRENYMLAKNKAGEDSAVSTEIRQLGFDGGDSEFEWMEDNRLKEIVFKVRENELAGRDPFHLMEADDKLAFFQGLEKKIERENENLSHLHMWLHSNIENLDYGADGISLYDLPEKIMPRWKGSAFEQIPEFLNNFLEQRKAISPGDANTPFLGRKGEQKFLHKSIESVGDLSSSISSAGGDINRSVSNKENAKTVIEGSDGSIRVGKKSGKEFWQHTKKWSRGFLESYNSETDPEVKSIMKDIGKDLDRWITEKEIQEAGELMTKFGEKNKLYLEKKLNKLKREMELFGPQAVVSKYREYAEDNEEDYLWWLDLPHILCIELYTVENGENRIGFYTLEMAKDLELEPKPQHVIAFEDAGDCRKLCYIIQAHLEMLGNGHVFVVPRSPKDAFREAKENGFNVTVIRKGELQLNVDLTLEEVEEMLCEIGSKMYHDMIMRERSVDISSVMKGALGISSKPQGRRHLKKKLSRSTEK